MERTSDNRSSGKKQRPLSKWLFVLCVAAQMVPIAASLAALVAAAVPDISLRADEALMEIQIRSVLSGEAPLLGPYSFHGFHHPGPLLFYLAAPLYALTGHSAGSLPLTALLLSALTLFAVHFVVFRAAGSRIAAWTAMVMAGWVYFAGETLMSIWNPHASILPFMLCIVSLAWFADQHIAALGPAALAGTLAMQSHLAYAPALAWCCMAAMGLYFWNRRTRPVSASPGSWPYLWLAAVGMALLAWVPPVVEQLTGKPGNLSQILAFLMEQPPARDWVEILRIAPSILAAFPLGWLLDASSLMTVALALAQVLALAVATGWWVRRRSMFLAALGVLTLGLHLVLIASLRAVVGPIHDYLVQWMTSVGALSWIVIGSAAMHLVPALSRWRVAVLATTAMGSAGLAIGATATLLAAVGSLEQGRPDDQEWAPIADACIERGGDGRWSGWEVRSLDGDSWIRVPDLINRLRKHGMEVMADHNLSWRYPPSYRSADPPPGTLLVGSAGVMNQLPPSIGGIVIGDNGRIALHAVTLGTPAEGRFSFAALPILATGFTGFTSLKQIQDQSFRWSDGESSSLTLSLDPARGYRVTVEMMPYVVPNSQQIVRISINGDETASASLQMQRVWQAVGFDVPAGCEICELGFRYAYTRRRQDARNSGDRSLLGVAFRTITVKEAKAVSGKAP